MCLIYKFTFKLNDIRVFFRVYLNIIYYNIVYYHLNNVTKY